MTFSIVARCARTDMFGVAISSSSPAVAARCAHVRAGVGAVATQNITDPRLGPHGLDLLAAGADAASVITSLAERAAPHAAYRQLLAVDGNGSAAGFSGENALGIYAHSASSNVAAGGNMLRESRIPDAMIESFLAAPDLHLGERLLLALEAAMTLGGEAGPVLSAGLLIAAEQPWPLADLRVDWDDEPIVRLRRLWSLWKPQMHDYVTRAIDPRSAPTYGVAGDP